MTDREKLIELLLNLPTDEPVLGKRMGKKIVTAHFIADYLIANGVVIREKGEWLNWKLDVIGQDEAWCGWTCSVCNHELVFDEAVTREDFASDFCPNCGSDMRGEKK